MINFLKKLFSPFACKHNKGSHYLVRTYHNTEGTVKDQILCCDKCLKPIEKPTQTISKGHWGEKKTYRKSRNTLVNFN